MEHPTDRRLRGLLLALVSALVAGALTLGAGGAGAATAPTRYLEPLQAHAAKLASLRRDIDRLGKASSPTTPEDAKARADEIRRAGHAYLVEARAFAKTLDAFVAGGTRRGLDSEVTTIRTTVGSVLATVDAYRVLAGGKLQPPPAKTPAALDRELRSALAAQLAERIPNKLVAEGVRKILAGASFQRVVRETLEQARQTAYATVDAQVRRVTGLGLRDLRDVGRALRLRANQEVDRIFGRLVLRATGNALVVELARQIVLPWLKAGLTELMRPHRTLDQRVEISIRSLRTAANGLNGLSPDARLSSVHARWQEAQAALAATHFLVADLKRAGREGLLSADYGDALSGVERAMQLAEVRFLLHKEDLVKTLAVERRELAGMLADLGNLVGNVLVPATGTLEDGLSQGTWTFGRVGGAVLCTVTLTKTPGKYGAYTLKACHANESYWKLEGKTLVFLHADGTRTSELTRKSATYWEGPYLGYPGIPADGTRHYIRR
jgi:hypothetical protein